MPVMEELNVSLSDASQMTHTMFSFFFNVISAVGKCALIFAQCVSNSNGIHILLGRKFLISPSTASSGYISSWY